MLRCRWLLVMEQVFDPHDEAPRYRLWLSDLDAPAEQGPVEVQTVDELMATLLAHWRQHTAGSGESALPQS